MKKQRMANNRKTSQPGMKTAEEIYRQQNQKLHKALAELRHPYLQYKQDWCSFFSQVLRRDVAGLSEMTLGERDKVLKAMQAKYPMIQIFNPAVPNSLRVWKKGDPAAGYVPRKEREPQLRMILALWTELGQEPETINKVIKKRYGVDDLRFLDGEMRRGFLNYLQHRLDAAGRRSKYYW